MRDFLFGVGKPRMRTWLNIYGRFPKAGDVRSLKNGGKMMDVKNEVECYLIQELDNCAEINLRGRSGEFDLWDVRGLVRRFVLLTPRAEVRKPTVGAVAVALDRARLEADRPAAFCAEWISAVERMRMVRRRIPFVLPGRQLYLPFLGYALRTEGSCRISRRLGKPAQRLLLAAVRGELPEVVTGLVVQRAADCSRATSFRVMNELEAFGLIHRVGPGCRFVNGLLEILAELQPRFGHSSVRDSLLDEIRRKFDGFGEVVQRR